MCGINGIFAYRASAPRISYEELIATRDAMIARGPDDQGDWVAADGRIGLGHRRLAIIDLSPSGRQPMATEDGHLQVVFNGEIYNYPELRKDLEKRGVRFHSHSDTEVLLHLYRLKGEKMLDHLRGMFAFAIWDTQARTLFLARDPYGIKPLYYADDGQTFRFASQVKALLRGRSVSQALDPAGVVGFLLSGSVPEPHTLYAAIRELPAGCFFIIGENARRGPVPYWDLSQAIADSIKTAESVPPGQEQDYLRASLVDSIRAHQVADVPVGAFLSAGLDSSTIVGLAAALSQQPVQTITLAFREFQGQLLDEAPLAAQIAEQFGTQHRCLIFDMDEMAAELPKFLEAMDQPTIDGLNTWLVSKAARQAGLKVALSGLGGDELFGGYTTFKRAPRLVARYSHLAEIPALGDFFRIAYSTFVAPFIRDGAHKAGLLKYSSNLHNAYWLVRGVFMPWELHRIIDADFARTGLKRLGDFVVTSACSDASLNCFATMVVLESSRYMRNQLLRDSDWTSMAHSLEIRTPLVDRKLTDAVAGLACTGRLGDGKSALPKCLSRPLPSEMLQRPKTGFTVPLWKWIRHMESMQAWKRLKFLRRPNITDDKRWAYTVLSLNPHTTSLLKR